MRLTEIRPLKDWIAIERKIVEQSGLDANVFDIEGRRISTFKQWANKLCPAIKDTDRGQSYICAVAHMNLSTIAKNTGKPIVEECDAGLIKLVVPVFYKGEFVGAFGACGGLLNNGEVDEFMINKTTDIKAETIETLSADIPVVDTKKIEAVKKAIIAEITQMGCQAELNKV